MKTRLKEIKKNIREHDPAKNETIVIENTVKKEEFPDKIVNHKAEVKQTFTSLGHGLFNVSTTMTNTKETTFTEKIEVKGDFSI